MRIHLEYQNRGEYMADRLLKLRLVDGEVMSFVGSSLSLALSPFAALLLLLSRGCGVPLLLSLPFPVPPFPPFCVWQCWWMRMTSDGGDYGDVYVWWSPS